jgi:hypothetical protein
VRFRAARFAAAVAALWAAAAAAQTAQPAAPAASAAPGEELRRLCATIPMTPADAKELARRAECVLAGMLPSPNRYAEASALGKAALGRGEASGGLMMYLAFLANPANQYLRDGKVDAEAYRRLAARGVDQRKDQVEAIEALGVAAGRGHAAAAVALAGYFHDTLAPRNVARLGAITGLLQRGGSHNPLVERFAREADAVARQAGSTKASVRAFLETYGPAVAAARSGYQARNGGQVCEQPPQLEFVSSGDIADAQYLPLTGNLVEGSYLVKGSWAETWNFRACGKDVPVEVSFAADGWGGAISSVQPRKAD